MSMQPVPWPEPDPQVAAAVKAVYGSRKTGRPLAVEIRGRLGQWLADEDFAGAFGIRGRPGLAPSRLALVRVLQQAEKLTDRLAAGAVRARLDRKYLLGLSLDDPGFDHTVLAEFRGKVAEAGLEQRACVADFTRRYGTPVTSWRPPASQAKRDELAVACARDGYALLEAVYHPSAPPCPRSTCCDGREVIRRREKEA